MTLSGFTFVRNASKYDYPVVESITSALSICDEFVVNVGDSEDDTLERIRAVDSKKIKIITSIWDPALRASGEILAQQTDIALSHCSGDWALYLQADEVLHEDDLSFIREAVLKHHTSPRVEGFVFDYLHFYGSYRTIACGREWYRREVRLLRPEGAKSFRDAQGFRKHGRKLNVISLPARVFHYGWVRPPAVMGRKKADFDRLWHDDRTAARMNPAPDQFRYDSGMLLRFFSGSHPRVMSDRIARQDWNFSPPGNAFVFRGSLFQRALWAIEQRTGIRLGEYRNYRIIGSYAKHS